MICPPQPMSYEYAVDMKSATISIFRYFQDKEEQKKCYKCHAGHYSDTTGSARCKKCEVMKYQPKIGMSNCLDCPPDANSTVTGAVSCSSSCKPGTISPQHNNKCQDCPPGQFQPGAGAKTCIKCSRGYYQSLPRQIECIQSAPGNHNFLNTLTLECTRTYTNTNDFSWVTFRCILTALLLLSPILSPQALCNISPSVIDRFSKTMCVLCTKFPNLSNATLSDFVSRFV